MADAGEIWFRALSGAGQQIGSGIGEALKEYHDREQRVNMQDAMMQELSQTPNPQTGKPIIDPKAYEAYMNHSGKQRMAIFGAKMGTMQVVNQLQKAVSNIATPVVDENNRVIGTQRHGVPTFFPQDIRNPDIQQRRDLAAAQKPLFDEIKRINTEFQKKYKTGPEAFGENAPIAVDANGLTVSGIPVSGDQLPYVKQQARRHADLTRAITTPDPIKTLKAMEWIRKNPGDPRALKWQQWINRQVGTQQAVDLAPTQPDQQAAPVDESAVDDETGNG